MKSVHATLQQWAGLSGNALKAQIAADLLPDAVPGIRTFLTLALDPSITYGVKGKLSTKNGPAWENLGETTIIMLEELSSRSLTGNAAKNALAQFTASASEQEVDLVNRVLNKDIRCGVGVKLLNEVGAAVDFQIPVFEVALCHPATEKLLKNGSWLGATKYDGMRALIQVRDNAVTFFTRSGKLIPALDPLAPAVLEVFGGNRVMLDSEAVSGTFQASVSSLRRSKNADGEIADKRLKLFDVVDLNEFLRADRKKEFGDPLEDRLTDLHEQMVDTPADHPLQIVPHVPVENWLHAQALFSEQLEAGEEGLILRRADAGYRKDRTNNWLKLKLEDTIDARIIDVFEGEGKYAGMLGGAIIEVDGKRCRVGGGWSDTERAEAWAAATGQAVHYRLDGKDLVAEYDEECSLIDRIIEAKFNGYTDDGALRHGRKKRFRDLDGEKA